MKDDNARGGTVPAVTDVTQAENNAASKRTFPEAFPADQDQFIPQSPYERRHTFELSSLSAGEPGHNSRDPPVPIQSPGTGPSVSHSLFLTSTSTLQNGFPSTPDLASYGGDRLMNPFPARIPPISTPSYDPSSLNHHQIYHLGAPLFFNTTSYPQSLSQVPLQVHPETQALPHVTFNHCDHHHAVGGRGGSSTSNNKNNDNANMTRHEVPPMPSEPMAAGPSPSFPRIFHPHSQPYNSFTRSSTTVMHHEERTDFHRMTSPQYYDPFPPDHGPDVSTPVTHEPTPTITVTVPGWELVECPGDGTPEEAEPATAGPNNEFHPTNRDQKVTRRKFSKTDLALTNETRKMRACVRCRMQRIRCEYDVRDPQGQCVTCAKVHMLSKKVIHRIPCLRYKLTEAVLHREGGLNLTMRWESNSLQLHNVGDWANAETRAIKLTLGICDVPMDLTVRKFYPREGDVLHRHWVDGNIKKKKILEPYALADVSSFAKYFRQYVAKHAPGSVLKLVQESDSLIKNTYEMAGRHYRILSLNACGRKDPEVEFLDILFRFVFALRHSTGSSWICGDDTLDMEPETEDKSYPLFDKVSTPRMIIAQFDSINGLKQLTPLRRELLTHLEGWVSSTRPKYWFTIYLACFILLHEVSQACEDRYRHARANSAQYRYTIPDFVTELQRGANIILAHWHYYKKDFDPLNMDIRMREKTCLNFLTVEQLTFIVQSFRDAAKKQNLFEFLWELDSWDHPFFFVSQLFELHWKPRKTWSVSYDPTKDERM